MLFWYFYDEIARVWAKIYGKNISLLNYLILIWNLVTVKSETLHNDINPFQLLTGYGWGS